MRHLLVFAVILGCSLPGALALADEKPDEEKSKRERWLDSVFESRRQHRQWQEDVRRQQEEAKRRRVNTFVIPQPRFNPRFDPRFDPRFGRGLDPRFHHRGGEYVLVPGHYQVVYGQLVYIPPHYQFVPR